MIDFIHHVFIGNTHVTQAILPLIIGLIAGAAQAMGNSQKEAGQRYEKAAAERLSPWSKLPIPGVQQANPAGDLAAGAFGGLQAQMDNPNGIKGLWNPNGTGPAAAAPEVTGAGAASGGLAGIQGGADDPNIAFPTSLNSLQVAKKPQQGFSPWRFLTGTRA